MYVYRRLFFLPHVLPRGVRIALAVSLLVGVAVAPIHSPLLAEDWPQFRGVNATGISREDDPLPGELDPDRHLFWKIPLAKGHSSPVVFDNRIYLTALRDDRLLTLAIDTHSGKLLWASEADYETLESVHQIGSPATPSVATDGHVVVSMFGSSGLHCYDLDGNLLWKKAMGPFDNSFGAAASPVIVDDMVVIVQDHDTGSFLAAFRKQTGEEVWRVPRSEFRRNYSTPVIWEQDGDKQVVIAGTAQVNAYDAKTGQHLWVVLRGARVVSATPVVGKDGQLYVVNSGGGEARDQPSFADLVATADANGNRLMEKDELPGSIIRNFLGQFDRNKDGSLNEVEYESIRKTMVYASPIAMAIKPGGRGDITKTHVAWTANKSIPRNASPLVVNGMLFMIKDGGILTVLDASSGEQLNAGRLRGTGKFFSSPVYGDGKIYAVSEFGKLNVITADSDWKQLATVDLGEDVYATPAIAAGRIYIRTVGHLYCFGLPDVPADDSADCFEKPTTGQSPEAFTLWTGPAIPDNVEEIPFVPGLQNRTIHQATADGYKFLHGAAIVHHKGVFYANWANSPTNENGPHETLQGRRSTDDGATWSDLEVIGPGFDGEERHSHGVLFVHQGEVWTICSRFGVGTAGQRFTGLQAEAFVFSEQTNRWESRGVVMKNCWPYDEPVRMANGNLITGGQDKDGLPVVAISQGNDVTKWDSVLIPFDPRLKPSYAETTVWAEGNRVIAVIRGGGGVAWVSTSNDSGRTWSRAAPSNMPMPRAKAYLGKLSTGQLYLLSNLKNRDTLVISVGRPGEQTLSRMWRIRHGKSGPPRFAGKAKGKQWSYPYGYEHDGKLYVVYSIGKEDCGLSVLPISSLNP